MSNDNPCAMGAITISRVNRSIATDALIQISDILGAASRLAATENREDMPAIQALLARVQDLDNAIFAVLESERVDSAAVYRTVRGAEMPEGMSPTDPDADRPRLKASGPGKDKSTKADLQQEVDVLRDKLRWAATLSATTLDQVSSFLRVTLIAMQSPDAYDHLGNIASTLEAMWGLTMDADNCMQAELESIGISSRVESRESIASAEMKSLTAYRESVLRNHHQVAAPDAQAA